MSGEGVALDGVRRFADASANFWRARPWDRWSGDELFRLDAPKPPAELSHFSIMGGGGQEFGLSFFDSIDAFAALYYGEELPAMLNGLWGVTFGPLAELPPADQRLWRDESLPVADAKRGYPLPMFMSVWGLRRPTARQLAAMTDVLHAAAAIQPGHFAESGATTLTIPGVARARKGKVVLAAMPAPG